MLSLCKKEHDVKFVPRPCNEELSFPLPSFSLFPLARGIGVLILGLPHQKRPESLAGGCWRSEFTGLSAFHFLCCTSLSI